MIVLLVAIVAAVVLAAAVLVAVDRWNVRELRAHGVDLPALKRQARERGWR